MKLFVFLRSRQALGLLTLVVLVIAAVGTIPPMVQNAREAANRASCSQNLRHIGLAAAIYEDVHHTLPSGLFVQPAALVGPPAPLPGTRFVPDRDDLQYGSNSGFSAMLPYFEGDNRQPKWISATLGMTRSGTHLRPLTSGAFSFAPAIAPRGTRVRIPPSISLCSLKYYSLRARFPRSERPLSLIRKRQ